MHALGLMTSHGFELGFGDNDFEGWTITVTYFLAAGLCAWAWRGERSLPRRDGRSTRPAVWMGFVALLIALGFNKQLDFQHWLIFTVRDAFAARPGLWASRYLIGGAVIGSAALVGLACGVAILRYIGNAFRRYTLALAGLVYLGTFIVVRAGSFLPLFNKLNSRHLDALHLVLELGSLLMIAAGAAQAIGTLRQRARAAGQDAMAEQGGYVMPMPTMQLAEASQDEAAAARQAA